MPNLENDILRDVTNIGFKGADIDYSADQMNEAIRNITGFFKVLIEWENVSNKKRFIEDQSFKGCD